MRICSAFIACAITTLVLLFAAMAANAQTVAGAEQGMKPYGSYEGGNIDSISMVNGSLTLHIPIISYPQRGGKLHMDFYLYYANTILKPLATCSAQTHMCSSSTYTVSRNNGADPISIVSVFPALGQTSTTSPYTVTTFDGAVHTLLQIGGTGDNYVSVDATGYFFNPVSGVLIDRDGTRYTGTGTFTVEDTNGNLVTENEVQGEFSDTLNRQIPAPSAATSTSDFAGCTGSQPTTRADLWSPPGPNGEPSKFKLCYASFSFPSITAPDCSGTCQPGSQTLTYLQSLVLPNGTAWTFEYDSMGDLSSITLPTGGTISYTWTSGGEASASTYIDPSTGVNTFLWLYGRTITSRTVNANDGTGPHVWNYSIPVNCQSQSPTASIVTDPASNDTVHWMTDLGGTCSAYETERDYYSGSHTSGTLLKKVVTNYNYNYNQSFFSLAFNVVPTTITTTDFTSGKVSEVSKPSYDSGISIGSGYNAIYGDLLTESDYDWGNGSPGPLLKTVNTNYLALSNGNYLSTNQLDLISSQQVIDAGGAQRSYTTYGYDEYSLNSSGVGTQHDANPPDGGYRGNQTSVHRWLIGSTVATSSCNISVSNGYLVSYAVYNDTGTVDHTVNSCGSSPSDTSHKTSYAYSSVYVGAYPTTITNPLGQQTADVYDFNTGLLISTTDPNLQPTSYTYDNLWRLSSITYPPGNGSDTITRQESSFPFSATLTKAISSSQSYIETNIFDGLGRLWHNEITSDPQGTIYTDTTYDALGRVASTSNPYRSTSDSTYGITYTTYDPLSRTILVTKPDGSKVTTAYCGPTTLITDEGLHWRRSTTDALGRLIEVDEPNSLTATVNSNGCPGTGDPVWVTTYGHDALGDLTSVVQSGSHNRTFSYDSLKHLTSSVNPETNANNGPPTTYGYDADGDVVTKSDARSITATYSYDVLNRITGITYSNGDPSVSYAYDQATCIGQSPCYNVGRRTSMTDAGGSESFSYDKMGRLWGQLRTTNSVPEQTTFAYNLSGGLTSLIYPSGRTVTYTYDSASRPSDAIDTANGINFLTGPCVNGASSPSTGACYAPQGSQAQTQNGAGIVSTYIYNSRLQPCWMFATSGAPLAANTNCTGTDPGSASAIDLQYGYNFGSTDNGNVIGIMNNRDTTRSQSFAYDQVNRITSAWTTSTSGSNCWGENYSYDQWANLEGIGIASGYSGCNQEGSWSATATTNNQLPSSVMSYDNSGNTVNDNFNLYQWNAEGEMKSGAGVNYTYDGDGNRVTKGTSTIYWYGLNGEVLEESDGSGKIQNEYVYFGGKRIAWVKY